MAYRATVAADSTEAITKILSETGISVGGVDVIASEKIEGTELTSYTVELIPENPVDDYSIR